MSSSSLSAPLSSQPVHRDRDMSLCSSVMRRKESCLETDRDIERNVHFSV
jgi:hypothetical protein